MHGPSPVTNYDYVHTILVSYLHQAVPWLPSSIKQWLSNPCLFMYQIIRCMLMDRRVDIWGTEVLNTINVNVPSFKNGGKMGCMQYASWDPKSWKLSDREKKKNRVSYKRRGGRGRCASLFVMHHLCLIIFKLIYDFKD